MDIDQKIELIKRNTEEIVTEEELKELLKTKKEPSVYCGWSITGKPHVGYFLPVLNLADFLKAGFKVKLLLADLHGALDKTPWDLLEKRYDYYLNTIPLMFKCINADTTNLKIVKGSDFQLSSDYLFDLLKLSTFSTIHDAKKASSDVVKQEENPKLAGIIYPLMQALDEEYLEVDIQYGGVDQRKIMMFAREHLPKINYPKRIEIMGPLIPGLAEGGKMSASIPHSKIDLLDEPETIRKKLSQAFCPEGETEGNGVLALLKFVIFVVKQNEGGKFTIQKPEKFGGEKLEYKTYEELEKDYIDKKIHPLDLKNALAEELIKLLEPIRSAMKGKEELVKEAYP
ncbi:tyrosine--tRNA ligase [Candidatus Woesearchaeota archaeon]|nr:MAG: tyrosine--tRNA ligase [Candidatus Woesearchaeota archaeon]